LYRPVKFERGDAKRHGVVIPWSGIRTATSSYLVQLTAEDRPPFGQVLIKSMILSSALLYTRTLIARTLDPLFRSRFNWPEAAASCHRDKIETPSSIFAKLELLARSTLPGSSPRSRKLTRDNSKLLFRINPDFWDSFSLCVVHLKNFGNRCCFLDDSD